MAAGTTTTSLTEKTTTPVQAADMKAFQETPYYQSLGIEKLQGQAQAYDADDSLLRSQAEAEYAPAYQMETEALRQQLEKEVQALAGKKSGVEAVYDRQRRQTNKAYDESVVDLNNELNKRGLGRSSLVSTQGAYLQQQRNQALSDIGEDENEAISAINDQIALLTSQAAQSERTLSGNYARQLEARVNELKEKNRSASVSLQLQIAALQQQGYEAYQEWLLKNRAQSLEEREYETKYGTSETQGSGTSGTSSKQRVQTKTEEKQKTGSGSIEELTESQNKIIKKLKATGTKTKTDSTASGNGAVGISRLMENLKQMSKR